MNRFIYSFIITLVFASCGQDSTKQKELELKEKELNLKEKELALKENPAPKNTDTVAALQTSTPSQPDVVQTEFKDFNDFFENFRKAVGQKNMKSVADFVNFPFDEQMNMMTKSEFIKNYKMGNDDINIITSTKPKKVSSSEYSLNNAAFGMSFKKNRDGNWKSSTFISIFIIGWPGWTEVYFPAFANTRSLCATLCDTSFDHKHQ